MQGGVRGPAGRSVVGIWAAGVALIVAFSMVVGTPGAQAAAEPDRGQAAQLLALLNAERAGAGLAPLSVSSVATEVAEGWSAHMADTDALAHNDAWFTAESRERAGAAAVGENVAYNADMADAHRRLMASPGHRANILDPRFHQVGLGVVPGTGRSFWITQNFLQLKNAPTVLSEPLPPPADPTNPPPPAPAPPAPSNPPTVPPAPAVAPVAPPTTHAPPAAIPPEPAGPAPAATALADGVSAEGAGAIDTSAGNAPPSELATGPRGGSTATREASVPPGAIVVAIAALAAVSARTFTVRRTGPAR